MLKLLLLAFLIWIVWTLFKNRHVIAAVGKMVRDIKAQAQAMAENQDRARRQARETQERRAQALEAQDMTPCPKCGAYVAVGETCGCAKG